MSIRRCKGTNAPRPPVGLSPLSRSMWTELLHEYSIQDSAGLAILREGLRSLDRAEAARRLLDRAGCVTKDRWGQVRVHPAAAVERDARAAFLAALRQLRIEVPI